MSAMPHARQVEHVFESLAVRKTAAGSQEPDLQPQWRLVSRDGSTCSVSSPPEGMPRECPDCLAGRCGKTPQGCQCSSGGDLVAISLDRLTGAKAARTPPDTPAGTALNAGMPRAKPQLFEQASKRSPTNFLEAAPRERQSFFHTTPAKGEAEPSSAPTPLVRDKLGKDRPATTLPVSQPANGELQQVINQWPRLPLSTRRAIMAIVGASSEADSA
jgi:hypothetical protein